MTVQIIRGFEVFADRYKYDFGAMSYANGWAQVDTSQDASYYGTWTNPDRLELFNYFEGDTCITRCETLDEYISTVRACAEWNKERGYWLGIDPGYDQHTKFEALGLGDLLH